jgi:hypothetical protein
LTACTTTTGRRAVVGGAHLDVSDDKLTLGPSALRTAATSVDFASDGLDGMKAR